MLYLVFILSVLAGLGPFHLANAAPRALDHSEPLTTVPTLRQYASVKQDSEINWSEPSSPELRFMRKVKRHNTNQATTTQGQATTQAQQSTQTTQQQTTQTTQAQTTQTTQAQTTQAKSTTQQQTTQTTQAQTRKHFIYRMDDHDFSMHNCNIRSSAIFQFFKWLHNHCSFYDFCWRSIYCVHHLRRQSIVNGVAMDLDYSNLISFKRGVIQPVHAVDFEHARSIILGWTVNHFECDRRDYHYLSSLHFYSSYKISQQLICIRVCHDYGTRNQHHDQWLERLDYHDHHDHDHDQWLERLD
ncbi:hypothetical protein LTR10_022570 [Elasticomyces elasticus]|uniref:Uncharacterized protein n=1 Tax=Exophiala sideris TaxID=1016849 RepID=A0ABR0J7G8_9EURO|nr:hypothetical protein LTR10_022570 [Elasticomyces elasticus]KAK5023537.1 hypothetical protein LTR13_011178 [Exophiala sideris]KAK5028673.1 hypothetical protein LTS07_006052 [Exophiala sideris]KAK5057177.1 hypothetical protein LTR69_007216 [Exophiala sideris]KAK5181850.1 hypothetical protein LTR44_006050 [Eurotiomycetes sp. CCFEE 6388]